MEAVELRYVQPKDIKYWWGTVKPGVECVLKKDKSGELPEDVYVSLKSGEAQLFTGMLDGVYHGFVICMKQKEALFIWMCYAPTAGVTDLFHPNLRELAREGGMTKLRFSSARNGWERLGADYGFKKKTVIYEAEVLDGF